MLRAFPAAAGLLNNTFFGGRQAASAVSSTVNTFSWRCAADIAPLASSAQKAHLFGSAPGCRATFSSGRDRSDEVPASKSSTGVSDDGAPAHEAENTSPLDLAYTSAPEQMGPNDLLVDNRDLRREDERGVGLTKQQVQQAAQPMAPMVEELDARQGVPHPAASAVSKLLGFAASWSSRLEMHT
jgi:hypothetical protein